MASTNPDTQLNLDPEEQDIVNDLDDGDIFNGFLNSRASGKEVKKKRTIEVIH
jgi:hypothetical protein